VNLWATRDGISYVARTDENTLAWKMTPANLSNSNGAKS
jgi:hypothetical protein